jgi:hypothetical protein
MPRIEERRLKCFQKINRHASKGKRMWQPPPQSFGQLPQQVVAAYEFEFELKTSRSPNLLGEGEAMH